MRPNRTYSPLAAALIAIVSAHALRAQDPGTGWTFSMKITTDSGAGATPMTMTMKQQIQGKNLRMEIGASTLPNAEMMQGSYTILDPVDSSMVNVTPNAHMAVKIPFKMFAGAGGMGTPVPHFTTDSVEDLGAGGAILGHDTRHFRRTLQGALDYTVSGRTCTRKVQQVSEHWIAPDLPLEQEIAESMKGATPFASADFTAASSVLRGKLPKGTSLRTIVRSTEPDAQGVTRTVTTTVEFLSAAREKIDDVAFQAPLDYQVQDMNEMMQMMPAGMIDSVMAASAERTLHAICSPPKAP